MEVSISSSIVNIRDNLRKIAKIGCINDYPQIAPDSDSPGNRLCPRQTKPKPTRDLRSLLATLRDIQSSSMLPTLGRNYQLNFVRT